MTPNLSILICSLTSRTEKRKELLKSLLEEMGEYYVEETHDRFYTIEKYVSEEIEIIVCTDNKEMTVGAKRNLLLKLARGAKVSFIDDDDKPHPYYAPILNAACKAAPEADVIVFDVVRYDSGVFDRNVKYDIRYGKDETRPTCYLRMPNHLMCVKREHALAVKFKAVNWGEDSDYATRLRPLLKTQHRIDDILYEYWFEEKGSETVGR